MAIDASQSKVDPQPQISQTSPSVESTQGGDDIYLFDPLIVLAERKRPIFRIATLFVSGAFVLSLMLFNSCTVMGPLLPHQQNSSMGVALVSQVRSFRAIAALAVRSPDPKYPNDMYVAMFESKIVKAAMTQKYGLMQESHCKFLSDMQKEFEKSAIPDGSGRDDLIQASVEDRDLLHAAELANGYFDHFHKLSMNPAIAEAGQRSLFFRQRREQVHGTKTAEENLKITKQKTRLILVSSLAAELIQLATSIGAQIAIKEVQIQSLHTYETGQNRKLVHAWQWVENVRDQLAKLGSSEGSTIALIASIVRIPEAGPECMHKSLAV